MLNLTEIPIAASSRRVYLSALAGLEKWLKGREITDETLAGYLSYLFDRGKSPSLAEQALKAARWRAECEDKPDPRGKLCKRAMASFRRQGAGRGRGQVDPILYEDVDKLVALAAAENTIHGDRDAVLFSLMSDGGLRIGEFAALNVEDIDFESNTIRVAKSKTDQFGVGANQWVRDRTLELIRVWLQRSKITSGPLFRPINDTYNRVRKVAMHKDSIRRILKKRAKAAGIEGRISGHSLRVGAAQSLTAMGATLVELQIAGRWTSPEMPAKYARKMSAQKSCVARLRNQ